MPAVSAATLVTPVPPITGSAFVAVTENTTPRSVTVPPLSAETVPPRRAVDDSTSVDVGDVTVGTPATPASSMVHASVAMMLARAAAAAPGEYRTLEAPNATLFFNSSASQPVSSAS